MIPGMVVRESDEIICKTGRHTGSTSTLSDEGENRTADSLTIPATEFGKTQKTLLDVDRMKKIATLARQNRTRFLTIVSLVVLSGCSDFEQAGPVVSGVVSFTNGEAVTGGRVEFRSRQPGVNGGIGKLHSDGSFSLMSGASAVGVPVGGYDVLVFPAERHQGESEEGEATELRVARKYSKEGKPLLEAIVTMEGPNEFIFEVEPESDKADRKRPAT